MGIVMGLMAVVMVAVVLASCRHEKMDGLHGKEEQKQGTVTDRHCKVPPASAEKSDTGELEKK